MSACRGQWADGRDFGVCIACGGWLVDHGVYMAWINETTYSERQAANFIPTIADPIPPLVFTDETTFTAIHPPYVNPNRGPYPGLVAPQPMPATAQAILDIGKATRSAGIARAVSGLQQRDWLLGAARWVP